MIDNKNNRWDKWNYDNDGLYFITISTKDRYEYFGVIKNNTQFNPYLVLDG